jgi:hypothetical protein
MEREEKRGDGACEVQKRGDLGAQDFIKKKKKHKIPFFQLSWGAAPLGGCYMRHLISVILDPFLVFVQGNKSSPVFDPLQAVLA